MSLKDVVLEIADEMEKEAEAFTKARTDFAPVVVRMWLKQLRQAVKASEGAEIQTAQNMATAFFSQPAGPRVNTAKPPGRDPLESPDDLTGGGRMILCVGGAGDGVSAPLDNRAPLGCFVQVGGEVYVYECQDGTDRLRFSASETIKFQEARAKGG
jgi:hypothetical protein